MDNLFVLADELRELREAKEGLKQELKDANAKIMAVEKRLTDAMTESECPNFTRGGKKFIMTTTSNWSPEPDRKDELYAALKKQGYGHLFSVNSRTLSGFVRDTVADTEDENGETRIPDWLSGLVSALP